MRQIKLTGVINEGRLSFHDRSSYKEFISTNEGDVSIVIKTLPKSRSPQQNNYYWMIVKEVSNEIGYTHLELHEIIKVKFNITSTKKLEQEEFSDFLDRLIRYFAQLGFPVEDPRHSLL